MLIAFSRRGCDAFFLDVHECSCHGMLQLGRREVLSAVLIRVHMKPVLLPSLLEDFVESTLVILLVDFEFSVKVILFVNLVDLVLGLIGQLVHMGSDHTLEERIACSPRLELSVDDLEGVRDCVVLTFQCAETGEDGVVDSLDQDDSVKRIKLLLSQIFVPPLNVTRNLGQELLSRLLSFLDFRYAEVFTGS